jgi:hypothetical protein
MTRNGAHRTLQDRRLAELSNSKRTAKNPRPKPKRDFFNRIDPLRPFDATLTERPFPEIELTIRWSVGGSGNGKNVSGTPGAVGKAARLRRLSRTETRVWGVRIVEDVGARPILRTTKAEALVTPRQPTSRETSAQTAE